MVQNIEARQSSFYIYQDFADHVALQGPKPRSMTLSRLLDKAPQREAFKNKLN